MKKRVLNIQSKLLIFITIAVALPLIVTILFNSYSTLQNEVALVEDSNNLKVKYIESKWFEIISRNKSTLETVSHNPQIHEYLLGDHSSEDMILEYLTEMDNNFGDGSVIVITGMDGQQLLRSSGDCVNIADRDYYQKALSGETNISPLVVSKATGKRIIIIAVPIKDEDGNIIGVCQRDFIVAQFRDILVENTAKNNEDIFVTDGNGQVLAHSAYEIADDEEYDESDAPFIKDSGTMSSGSFVSDAHNGSWLISWSKGDLTNFYTVVARDRIAIMKTIYRQLIICLILSLVCFVIVVVLSIIFARSISVPIKNLSNVADKLASGDFTSEIPSIKRHDEIGNLIESFNNMKLSLGNLLSKARDSAEEVSNLAESFSSLSEQSTTALESISESTLDLTNSSDKQSASVNEALESMDVMIEAIDGVVNSVNEVQSTSLETNKKAQSGAELIERVVSTMTALQDDMTKLQDVVISMDKQSEEINAIVNIISDIASQTNLLALNASIEAARAGEHGKGFAVVATEVGNLAQQSRDSSDNIKQLIDNIRAVTIEATTQIKKGVSAVSESSEAVNEAGVAFTEIVENIKGLSSQIDSAVAETKEIIQVGNNTKEIVSELSSIADDVSGKAQLISAATTEQTASMEEVSTSSKHMSEAAITLEEEVNKFQF